MTEPDGIDFNQDALADELRAAFGIGAGDDEVALELNLDTHAASSQAAVSLSDADRLAAGARIADFRIIEELGHGGMGVVYRATQLSLDREVALKVLPNRARKGRTAIQRFRSEARAAARLHHTNIVPVFAHGDDNGQFYYAMDLIEGGSLDQAIRFRTRLLSPSNRTLIESVGFGGSSAAETIHVERPASDGTRRSQSSMASSDIAATGEISGIDVKSLQRASSDYRHLARLIAEVADALDHAHSQGVIHRDIKPHNLLVGADQRLHVTDFGLARLTDEPTLTASGEVMGTPFYLSPEMIDASMGGVDHRTDIYSLGVTFYELLTLRRAVTGETRDQILTGIRTQQPSPPRKHDARIPKDLETICLKAMEKDPKYRYATAGAMATDLRRFAEGRPILSRRTGIIGRGIKWAKRNKAASFALVTTCVMVLFGAGLAISVSGSRRERAAGLIDDVYEQLIYKDYHKTDGLSESLDEAESLGGAGSGVALLRGMSSGCLQGDRARCPESIAQMEAARVDDPDNPELLYALASAYDRNNEETETVKLIEEADALDNRSAEAWFLRGLALHWDDPDEAIHSYQQARDLRADEGEFFPQAHLQLGRAYNQRMYRDRNNNDLANARSALTAVIDRKVYGGYPYYLLSIAEELAGEMYLGSKGTRGDGDDEAMKHFEESLAVAREGQQVDPTNPSPYSAKAFCLEAMGQYREAIEAQTKVMELGPNGEDRWCEALHYRWRLNYWIGSFDEALADIESHRGCKQQSAAYIYNHVYPMLVEAERGNREKAIRHAYAITEDAPNDALAVIWTATCLRILGDGQAAVEHLNGAVERVAYEPGPEPFETVEWKKALMAMVRGEKTLAELVQIAEEADQPWRLRGEAEYHAAAIELARGDRKSAFEGFERAYRSFDRATRYSYHAETLLRKMEADTSWPPWIAANSLDSDASNVVKP
ncbi:MAG TPA: protein kinase [Phycisphaerae bacterium]|nr:protein kinase [Phycisphaerae bacterium]